MGAWGNFSETIIEHIQSGVILLDNDGRIADLNRFAADLLQIDKAAWIGRSACDLFPELDMSVIRRTQIEKTAMQIEQLRFQREDQELLLSAEAAPLIVLGQPVGAFLTFQDRTQFQAVYKDVLRVERLAVIGSMAAGTVHEIRNPLTTIKGFLQLFERDIKQLAVMGLVQKNFVDKCAGMFPLLFSEIQKIERILSDFLLISKPQEVRFQAIQINDLLHEVLPRIQECALFHNVRIVCEFPRKNPKFFGDRDELACVVMNLVENSLEAIEHDAGEIRLSVEVFDNYFRLTVRDNGTGMPADQIGSVFDPFTTTKPDRPGLGLSICQQVITRMGGHISITSELGVGTAVHIELPCFREEGSSFQEMRPDANAV
ncbi:two-component system sensor histidine kinase NtrB [Effusibacillus pohliae]|uniref:two-component system sensor histidine kinase NtrB n=1 Tax=Effusibacillus pohliae TaxID=232270 RepID=UPI00036D64C2|nr:ATP-binding protein [Effusibacillus pohliae]